MSKPSVPNRGFPSSSRLEDGSESGVLRPSAQQSGGRRASSRLSALNPTVSVHQSVALSLSAAGASSGAIAVPNTSRSSLSPRYREARSNSFSSSIPSVGKTSPRPGSGGRRPSAMRRTPIPNLSLSTTPNLKNQRTSKTSQKLVVLPSAPQTKSLKVASFLLKSKPPHGLNTTRDGVEDEDDLDELTLTLGSPTGDGSQPVREYKSLAERMTKEERKKAGYKRITAYCIAEGLKMKLLASFLKREHNVHPRVFDEALYVMYHLPLLPGYSPNINIRSSAPLAPAKGGKSFLTRLDEAEENGYQGTYFSQTQSTNQGGETNASTPGDLGAGHLDGNNGYGNSNPNPNANDLGYITTNSPVDTRGTPLHHHTPQHQYESSSYGSNNSTTLTLPQVILPLQLQPLPSPFDAIPTIDDHTPATDASQSEFEPSSADALTPAEHTGGRRDRDTHTPRLGHHDKLVVRVALPDSTNYGDTNTDTDTSIDTDMDLGAETDPGVYPPWTPPPHHPSAQIPTSAATVESEAESKPLVTRTSSSSPIVGTMTTSTATLRPPTPPLIRTLSSPPALTVDEESKGFEREHGGEWQMDYERTREVESRERNTDSEREKGDELERVRQSEYQKALEREREREKQKEREQELDSIAEVIFFSYGVVVFFGLTERQEKDILEDVESTGVVKRKIKEEDWEVEECHFDHDPSIAYPRIYNDFFTLKSRSHLLKLSIAHALAQSTLLAHYETTANRVLSSPLTLSIPLQLAQSGKIHLRRHEALKLTGRLFKLRRDVNLVSNVLDVPELFWSEASLKGLYDAVRDYMELGPRVQVLNEKLGVASDFLDAIHDHLNNSAMERITWIVIWLIAVAIFVELGEVIARLIVHASIENGRSTPPISSVCACPSPPIANIVSATPLSKEDALRTLERMMRVQESSN